MLIQRRTAVEELRKFKLPKPYEYKQANSQLSTKDNSEASISMQEDSSSLLFRKKLLPVQQQSVSSIASAERHEARKAVQFAIQDRVDQLLEEQRRKYDT